MKMKFSMFLIFVLFMSGCSNKPNLPLNKIESAVLGCKEGCGYYAELSQEDIERFVNSFNLIEEWRYNDLLNSEDVYGYHPRIITFYTKNKEIKVGYNYLGHVGYDHVYYDVPLIEEFHDVARDLELKYFEDEAVTWQNHWEAINAYNEDDDEYRGLGNEYDNTIIVSPKCTIHEILEELEIDNKIEKDQTISEVFESYNGDIQLYETISFEKYDIKIIEMVDNQVEAVVFIYKG